MKYIAAAIIYVGFFGLIGCAVYWTQSGWSLWALLFIPTLKSKTKKGKPKDKIS